MSSVVKDIGGVCTFCGVVAVAIVAVSTLAILIWIQLM